MATLENFRIYEISKTEANVYKLYGNAAQVHYSLKRADGASGPFQVGDKITGTLFYGATNVTNFEFTYSGRDSNGMILERSEKPYYFSQNVYEAGTVLTTNGDPYPVCFAKGSQIVTHRGPIAIEDLLPGDSVQTQSGWGTVKWVGHRSYGPAALRTIDQKIAAAPVRIRADAIKPKVPSNDLLVSPWHHLMVEGHLVRANDLINGTTIVQETRLTSVDYYHVELEQFDVIMAHGIYSESWADGGNRSFFQNADVTALRPEDDKRRRASRPGFDHLVLRKGKKLEAIQKTVAKRAQLLATKDAVIHKAA